MAAQLRVRKPGRPTGMPRPLISVIHANAATVVADDGLGRAPVVREAAQARSGELAGVLRVPGRTLAPASFFVARRGPVGAKPFPYAIVRFR